MDYEKYSKSNFEALGANTSAARKLADALQDDVLRELHGAVESAFLDIVKSLNAKGHKLQPYGEVSPGDIPYRDPGALRLGVDVVISAGYSHTYEEET